MRSRLLRPFLILEFAVCVQVFLTAWSQIGGQSHLDLVFWPWKLGLSLAGAALVTAISSEAAAPKLRPRVWLFGLLLVATVAAAGFLSYQAHLNEPDESDYDESDSGTMPTAIHRTAGYQTRQDFSARTIG